MNFEQEENRKKEYPRYATEIPVGIRLSGNGHDCRIEVEGSILSLGRGGALLSTSAQIFPQTSIILDLSPAFPPEKREDGERKEVTGKVIQKRSHENGKAWYEVEFPNDDEDEIDVIVSLICHLLIEGSAVLEPDESAEEFTA